MPNLSANGSSTLAGLADLARRRDGAGQGRRERSYWSENTGAIEDEGSRRSRAALRLSRCSAKSAQAATAKARSPFVRKRLLSDQPVSCGFERGIEACSSTRLAQPGSLLALRSAR